MNFGMGKLAVLFVAVAIAAGGIGAAVADWRSSDAGESIELVADDMRKNELDDEVAAGGDDEGDGDRTRGNDGTSGGDNTGDGDWTIGDDGTAGGDNTGVVGGGGDSATGGGGTT